MTNIWNIIIPPKKSSVNNPTLPANVYNPSPSQSGSSSSSGGRTINLGEIGTGPPRSSGGGGGGGGGGSFYVPPIAPPTPQPIAQPVSDLNNPTPSAGDINKGVVNTPTGGVSTAFPERYNNTVPYSDSNLSNQLTGPSYGVTPRERLMEDIRSGNAPSEKAVIAGSKPLISREDELTTGYTLGGAAKTSVKNLFSFGTIGKQGFGVYWDEVFNPFNEANIVGRADVNPGLFRKGRGTHITDPAFLPVDFRDTSKMSMGEFEVNQRLRSGESYETAMMPPEAALGYESNKIQKKIDTEFNSAFKQGGMYYDDSNKMFDIYQKRVDKGEMTVDEAQKGFDTAFDLYVKTKEPEYLGKAQKEYDIVSGKFISQRKQSGNIITGVKSSERFGDQLKFGAELGAFAATGGSIIGTTGTAAIIAGTSSQNFARGILGDDLTLGQRAGELGIGAFKIGVGGALVNRALGKTPKSLISQANVRDYQNDLSFKEFRLRSPESMELVNTNEGQAFKVVLKRNVGGMAKQDSTLFMPVFKTGEKTFSITGGKGVVKTKIYDVFSDTTFKSIKPVSLTGKGTIQELTGFKAVSPRLKLTQEFNTDEMQLATGSGIVRVKGESGFKTFKFAGVSSDAGDVYKIAGVSPSSIGYNKNNFFNIRLKGRLSNFGEIKKATPLAEDTGYTVFSGKQSTRTIQKPIAPSFAQEFAQQSGNAVLPKLTPPKVVNIFSWSSGVSPKVQQIQQSQYYGLGMYEKTDEAQMTMPGFDSRKMVGIKPDYFFKERSWQGTSLGGLKLEGARERPMVSMAGGTMFSVGPVQRPKPLVGFGDIQSPRLNDGQRQTMKLRSPRLNNQFMIPDFRPDFSFNNKGRRFKFDLPDLDLGFENIVGKTKKGKRRLTRTPSFAALDIGIRSSKPLKFEFTGLQMRPIIA